MTAANENVTENGEAPVKAPMFLKVLVVVLGLAIIGMLGLIIFKVMAGDHKKKTPVQVSETQQPAGLKTIAPKSFVLIGDIVVTRPAGSKLISATTNGREATLHFSSADVDVVMTVDRVTGEKSTITIPK
jgi:hypothetical protein